MAIRPIQPDEVNGVGGSSVFSEDGILYIFREPKGHHIAIELPAECIALFGVPALLQLDVTLDRYLRLPRFPPLVCHLGEKRLR
jgi:hypothetical protein